MLRRKLLRPVILAIPLLVVAGWVTANSLSPGYVCPLTGEELPCEQCCPLNAQAASAPQASPVKGELVCYSQCCLQAQQR